MKKGIFYILIFAALLPFAACKEDVPTIFAEPDGIYFSAPADSMTYTFAKYPGRVTDTIKVPVTVLGKPSDKDRSISIEKVSEAGINATEGVHYKLLQPYTLSAGKVSTTLPVVIYRTGDMDSLSIPLSALADKQPAFQAFPLGEFSLHDFRRILAFDVNFFEFLIR